MSFPARTMTRTVKMAAQAWFDYGVDRLKKSVVTGKFLGRRTTMAMRFGVPLHDLRRIGTRHSGASAGDRLTHFQ